MLLMRIKSWVGVFICLQLCFAFSAGAHWEQFKIKTNDEITYLRGQIDFPPKMQSKKFPLVVMMPGTGLFDRDVAFSNPADSKVALVFKDLSESLNAHGIATLRFDYRGVGCDFETMPKCELCKTKEEKINLFFNICYNNAIRQSVTPETLRSDLRQVYEWGASHPSIDSEKIIVFAHSEGSVHTAHLVGRKKIKPKGVVLMGGVFSDISSVIRWQYVDRTAIIYKSMDTNKDNALSRSEIEKNFPESPLLKTSNQDNWTFEDLDKYLNSEYEKDRLNILKSNDSLPYPSASFVQGSMAWWKMFFLQESTSLIDLWHQADIPVINHIGSNDIQVWLQNEKDILKANPSVQIQIVEHLEKGHTLGIDPIYGPISPESKQRLIKSIQLLLD